MLTPIIEFIEEVKAMYPDTPLERGGDIEYANGNDSTPFDWECNDRLCEFGCGYDDGKVWAFKLMVSKDGTAKMYCYPNGESSPVRTIERILYTDSEMEEVYQYVLEHFDYRGNYDVFLSEVEL